MALAADTLEQTENLMIKVAAGVAIISWTYAFLVGGFQQRPHVANLFGWAFLAWPLFLLVAKGFNPALSWVRLWFSVPIMSWYLVNLSMLFYYPVNGGGGGLGAGFGFILGWFYMVPLFAVLSGIFIGGRLLVRSLRQRRRDKSKSTVRITLKI